MTEKLTVTVDEMAEMLGICRLTAYQLAHSKGFPAIRISARRIVIPVEALKKWIAVQAGDSYEV